LISKKIFHAKGFHLSANVEKKLLSIFAVGTNVQNAGNGRYARNICEAAIRAHALRVSQITKPSVEQLTTIEAVDLKEMEN